MGATPSPLCKIFIGPMLCIEKLKKALFFLLFKLHSIKFLKKIPLLLFKLLAASGWRRSRQKNEPNNIWAWYFYMGFSYIGLRKKLSLLKVHTTKSLFKKILKHKNFTCQIHTYTFSHEFLFIFVLFHMT